MDIFGNGVGTFGKAAKHNEVRVAQNNPRNVDSETEQRLLNKMKNAIYVYTFGNSDNQ